MSDAERPRSPFAGMPDFSARTPVRVLSLDLIEQMLAEHQLYLKTEYHQGHRANFASADLTGRDFSSLNLRGIKMDRAVLKGADFTGTHLQRATLIGAMLQEACFDRADLSGARLSGANLVSASLEDACLAKADVEFALMAKVLLRGACMHEADMSGAQLDGAVLTRADLQKANLRGAGFRDARLDEADLRDARLGGAFLVGALLRGADLRGAYLRLAKLDGADLSDANLYDAEGLTPAQLTLAHYRHTTIAQLSCPGPGRGWKMPTDEHVAVLARGAAVWNAWRAEHDEAPDLSRAALRGLDLTGFDLSRVDLRGADASDRRHAGRHPDRRATPRRRPHCWDCALAFRGSAAGLGGLVSCLVKPSSLI